MFLVKPVYELWDRSVGTQRHLQAIANTIAFWKSVADAPALKNEPWSAEVDLESELSAEVTRAQLS